MMNTINPAMRASGMTLPIPSTQTIAGMMPVPPRPILPLMMAVNTQMAKPQMTANRRGKNGQAPEQARHRQGGIYRSGEKWASNGARTFSGWVRRTTQVHSPGHRLDQHREPKASRPSKFAQPPLHEAAQPIQVPRSIRKHKPLREDRKSTRLNSSHVALS